jgi:hypothetical protein
MFKDLDFVVGFDGGKSLRLWIFGSSKFVAAR